MSLSEQVVAADDTAVVVESVSKTFLTRKGVAVDALRQVTLDIRRGEVLALLGPSGCGKSTLLRILAGIERQYTGAIEWASNSVALNTEGRLRAATVFQQDSSLPWRTVAKNIELGLSRLHLTRNEAQKRVSEYAELVGLGRFRSAYPHELSGGMRQRVAIARALACQPMVLLMDEPLAALDAQTRLVMQAELVKLHQAIPTTVVYVTHDIDEAISLADRIIVMTARPGRIKADRRVDLPAKVGEMGVGGLLTLRESAEFRRLAIELWEALADEVGDALGS